MSGRILVLEDDESLRLVITKALARAGFEARATASIETAIQRFADREADLLVADVLLGQQSFLDRLNEVRASRPDAPVIVISAQTTAATALAAEHGGAFEYLPKPFDLDDLVAAATRALGRTRPAMEPRRSAPAGASTDLIGRSGAMQDVFRDLARLSRSAIPVLITGPEGSGRASLARALHAAGPAPRAPIRIAGPVELGSDAERVFQDAAGGMALLRRAERWSANAQAQVLEALEKRGGAGPRVAATALPQVREHLDPALYEALAVGFAAMPPLRSRGGDIALLFRRFLAEGGLGEAVLTPDACAFLEAYPWPGEVRELARVAGRIAAQAGRAPVTLETLRGALAAPSEAAEDDALEIAAMNFAARRLAAGAGDIAEAAHGRVDRALIRAALAAAGGVRQEAARRLGLNRNTLARRIEALGMDDGDG